MNSVQFLDAVRARHKIPSDRKLAKFLKMPQARVSAVRTGARKVDPDMAIKVAGALDFSAEYVLAEIQAERARKTRHAVIWKRLARLAKKAQAAALLIAITGLLNLSPAGVSQAKGVSEAAPLNDLYIIRIRRRGKGKGTSRNTVMRPLRRLFAAWRTVSRRTRHYGSSGAMRRTQATQIASGLCP